MINHIFRILSVLFLFAFIISCQGREQLTKKPLETNQSSHYEYQLGLGYGFLDKMVEVTINDQEVLSLIGTDEIEDYAQLLGTMMLRSGSSPEKDIIVKAIVDGGQPYEQVIDLSTGMFVHIYLEGTGLNIYNTSFLVLE